MIKGYQKRIIFVKDTGCDLFDEAYFILKKDVPSHLALEDDIVRTATALINEGAFPHSEQRKRRIPRGLLIFLSGCAAGALLCSLIFALLF